MKKLNIDDYLKESAIEFTINDKTFVVEDVSEEAEKLMMEENTRPKTLVKEILGATDEDLKGYGLKACTHIIKAVTDSFLEQNTSQNDQ